MHILVQLDNECDRCNAPAKYRATKEKIFAQIDTLMFCGHHGHIHYETLIARGWIIEEMEKS